MDRTRYTLEIFGELTKLAKKDLRICQVFSNLTDIMRRDGIDIFYAENNLLLEYLKGYNNEILQ